MKVVQDRSCHCFLDVVVILGKELLVALGESKIFEHLLVELPVSLRLHQLHDALAAETVLWDLSMDLAVSRGDTVILDGQGGVEHSLFVLEDNQILL